MSETEHLGIDVSLFCPAQHHVGNLVKFETQIGYRQKGGQLAAWPPHQTDMWWEVRCPTAALAPSAVLSTRSARRWTGSRLIPTGRMPTTP